MSDTNRFYVYLHTRASDGKVFYVGKGTGRRWRHHNGRNVHWQRTVNKHGVQPHVLFAGLPESIAFELETFVIAHLRQNDAKLVNLCDGGEGVSGKKSKFVKPILCVETGQVFASNMDAAQWVQSYGIQAIPKSIQSALLKGRKAYGLTWMYPEPGTSYVPSNPAAKPILKKDTYAPKVKPAPKPRGPQVVCLETGTVYQDMKKALAWVRTYVPQADAANLHLAIKSRASAYGLTWQHVTTPGTPYVPTRPGALPFHKAARAVQCIETGKVFTNTTEAAQWVSTVRNKPSHRRKISDNCVGVSQTAFGYTWRYIDPSNEPS